MQQVQQGSTVLASYTLRQAQGEPYDGDGNRIKSVMNGETITYVGSLYEKKVVGSRTTHTKYYTFGSQRIAVRVAGILSWLLSDHLGSTAVTADGATGGRTGELWYKPWGEYRGTAFGATPTTFNPSTGSGQASRVSGGIADRGCCIMAHAGMIRSSGGSSVRIRSCRSRAIRRA